MARDFGFAPNPFHGACTLATCKPVIRRVAKVGDWVVGVGGARLEARGRLVFAMQVTEVLTFDEYWEDIRFRDKRPVRNGSRVMLVGDNIYRSHPDTGDWVQADSHHSLPDGSPNPHNVGHDTQTDRVLISKRFYYFGRSAPSIPSEILEHLRFKNGQGHRTYSMDEARCLTAWLFDTFVEEVGIVADDPFDFDRSALRYSSESNTLR